MCFALGTIHQSVHNVGKLVNTYLANFIEVRANDNSDILFSHPHESSDSRTHRRTVICAADFVPLELARKTFCGNPT